MFDVSKTHPSFIVAEVFRLSHLVLAAPTYNGGLYYAMDALLREMAALNVRKRGVAVVENGSWGTGGGQGDGDAAGRHDGNGAARRRR